MRAHPLHDAPSGAFVKEWPSTDFLQTLALAQHYGLPTRLLDWSHDAMVAAYFASIGATRRLLDGSEETDSGSRLCVWALDHLIAGTAAPLRFVVPPYAENPNLAAQQGLFTSWVTESLVVDGKIENGEVDRRCLTDLLHEVFDKPQVHAFRQITLDVRHSPALASVLRALGYSAGRMFPGYNGAAADVLEGAEIKAAMSQSAD